MHARELLGEAQLVQAPIGDEVQVLFHHRRVHTQNTSRHGVTCVLNLERCPLENHLRDLFLEFFGPEMRVFQFYLVDHIDTEVQVHRLVAEDVLKLFCNAGHLIAASHGQDLREAAIEEDAFCNTIEANEIAQ